MRAQPAQCLRRKYFGTGTEARAIASQKSERNNQIKVVSSKPNVYNAFYVIIVLASIMFSVPLCHLEKKYLKIYNKIHENRQRLRLRRRGFDRLALVLR